MEGMDLKGELSYYSKKRGQDVQFFTSKYPLYMGQKSVKLTNGNREYAVALSCRTSQWLDVSNHIITGKFKVGKPIDLSVYGREYLAGQVESRLLSFARGGNKWNTQQK